MDDSRLNVTLALTAIEHGAAVANHVELKQLLKNERGIISGGIVKDTLSGEEFTVKSKIVINATGAFVGMKVEEENRLIIFYRSHSKNVSSKCYKSCFSFLRSSCKYSLN